MQVKCVKDYYEQMYAKFPEVPKEDIRRILNFGWKSVYLHNVFGGDTLLNNGKLFFLIGWLTNDSLRHVNYYIRKLVTKMRIMIRKKKIPWDGYYYFALTEPQYQHYLSQINTRGRKRKKFEYGNVILHKYLDICKVAGFNRLHIFRTELPIELGMFCYKPKYTTDKAELIITREPMKFTDILVSNSNYEALK